ncbi:MAG: phosphopantetheine-binding protein [Candidatus Buchananbacteria bacterium]
MLEQIDPIAERITAIISEKLDVSVEELTSATDLMRDLGIDSLDLMEIDGELMCEFNLPIDTPSLVDMSGDISLQTCVDLVKNHMPASA